MITPKWKYSMIVKTPFNAMQRLARRRERIIYGIVLSFVIVLTASMMVRRVQAIGEAWNPGNADYSALPSSFYTQCNPDCTTYAAFTGRVWDAVAQSVAGGPWSCVLPINNSTIQAGRYGSSLYPNELSATNDNGLCWYSGAWHTDLGIFSNVYRYASPGTLVIGSTGSLLTSVLNSPRDVYYNSGDYNFAGSYGLGSVNTNDKIMDANFQQDSISIRADKYSVAAGEPVTFSVNWSGAPVGFAILKFYTNTDDSTPARTIFISDPQFDETEVFGYTFYEPSPYGQPFNPWVELTSTTGTVYFSGNLEQSITVTSWGGQAEQQDITYASTFSASKTDDVIVGETVTFSYDLSSNFCTGSGGGVSNKRLFLGYPPSLSSTDTGALLTASMSGSKAIQITRTAQPFSDFLFPYIRLTCGNSTQYKVYLGGSLNQNKGQPISVYEADNVRFALPASWLNGGGSVDYAAGTGAYFASDKHIYRVNEPVKLKWVFNEPFTVGSVAMYDNQGGTLLYIFTGSTAVQEGTNHYGTIRYSSAGEFQPYMQVRSTAFDAENPATYQNIYLGGIAAPFSENAIVITNQTQPIWVNTGATILGTDIGTGGVLQITKAGVFALPGMNFQGFGSTGNAFLDGAQSLLLVVVWAAIWVAQKLYLILSATHIFSFIFETMHPANGAHLALPDTLFHFSMPAGLRGDEFTVHYATGENAQNVTYLVQLGVMISLFLWTLRKVIYSSHS